MDLKKAVQHFLDQGFVFQTDSDDLREVIVQALVSGAIPDDIYKMWAVENLEIPLIRDEFFTQFQPSLEFWDNCQGILPWDEGFLPVVLWDNQIVAMGYLPPSNTEHVTSFIFLLASKNHMETLWKFYHSQHQVVLPEREEKPPVTVTLEQIPTPPPEATSTLEQQQPKLSQPETTASLSELQPPHPQEGPSEATQFKAIELIDLSELEPEGSPSEENSEKSTESPEDENSGLAPDGFLVSEETAPSPLKSLQNKTETEVSQNHEKSQAVAPILLKASTPDIQNASTTEDPLQNLDDNDTLLPPPPPPDAPPLSLIQEDKAIAKATEAVGDSSKLSPIALEKMKRHDLCQIIPFSKLQEKITSLCENMKDPYDRLFFGLIHPEQKQLQIAMIKPQDDFLAWVDAPQISLQQASVCTIPLRTLKSFYGTPITNPLNQKIFDITNDSKTPENLTIVPLVHGDKVLGLVGLMNKKTHYNLEKLSAFENQIRQIFEEYSEIKVTDFNKAG